MDFSFMEDERWFALTSKEKGQMLSHSFQTNIASDERFPSLSPKMQSVMRDNYLEEAKAQEAYILAPEKRGILSDIASHAARGAVGVVSNIGEVAELSDLTPEEIDPEEGLFDRIGRKLKSWSKETLRETPFLQPSKEELQGDIGFVKRGVMGGVEAMPLSATVGAGAVAGALATSWIPVPGARIVGGIGGGLIALVTQFGAGEYGKTYSDAYKEISLTQPNISEDEKRATAHRVAFGSAAFEVGTELPEHLMALYTLGGSKVLTTPIKATLKNMLKTPLKALLKGTGKQMLFGVGTEMVAGGGQAWVRQKEGLLGPDIKTGVMESIIPAITMSIFFGAGATGLNKAQSRSLQNRLNSSKTFTRIQAADQMSQRILANTKDASLASAWKQGAMDIIYSGEQFVFDEKVVDFASIKMAEDIEQEIAYEKVQADEKVAKEEAVKDIGEARSVGEAVTAFQEATVPGPSELALQQQEIIDRTAMVDPFALPPGFIRTPSGEIMQKEFYEEIAAPKPTPPTPPSPPVEEIIEHIKPKEMPRAEEIRRKDREKREKERIDREEAEKLQVRRLKEERLKAVKREVESEKEELPLPIEEEREEDIVSPKEPFDSSKLFRKAAKEKLSKLTKDDLSAMDVISLDNLYASITLGNGKLYKKLYWQKEDYITRLTDLQEKEELKEAKTFLKEEIISKEEKEVKEPWEMSRKEVAISKGFDPAQLPKKPLPVVEAKEISITAQVDNVHREAIKEAISEGKTIPPEVIAEYPDIQEEIPVKEVEKKEIPIKPPPSKPERKELTTKDYQAFQKKLSKEAPKVFKKQKETLLKEIDVAIKKEATAIKIEDTYYEDTPVQNIIELLNTHRISGDAANEYSFTLAGATFTSYGNTLLNFKKRIKATTFAPKKILPKERRKPLPVARYKKLMDVPPKDLSPAQVDPLFQEVAEIEARAPTGDILLNPFQNWLLAQHISKETRKAIRDVAGKDYVGIVYKIGGQKDITSAKEMLKYHQERKDTLQTYFDKYQAGEITLKQINQETGIKRSFHILGDDLSEAKYNLESSRQDLLKKYEATKFETKEAEREYKRLKEGKLPLIEKEIPIEDVKDIEANKEAYGSQKKADAAIESVAGELDTFSKKRMPDREGILLGESSIVRDLRKKKRVDFTGRQLIKGNEGREIAELFQVYRSPKIEILHTIYRSKDGTILAHNAMTSGQIDRVTPKDITKYISKMLSAAKRLGASKIDILHNHPAGDPTMSRADMRMAARVAVDLEDLMGNFLVIDHGKYTSLTLPRMETLEGVTYPAIQKDIIEDTYTPSPDIPNWIDGKTKLLHPKDVANFGASLKYDKTKAVFVYLDSANAIQGWTTHNKKILKKDPKDLKNIVVQQTKAHDASIAVIIADDDKALNILVRSDVGVFPWLLDVQNTQGGSYRIGYPQAFAKGKEAPPKLAWGMFAPKEEYITPTPDIASKKLVQNLNDHLVDYFEKEEWRSAYTVDMEVHTNIQEIIDAFRETFQTRIIPVQPTTESASAIGAQTYRGKLYVNTRAGFGFVPLAGHELLHHLKRTAPKEYKTFTKASRHFYKNLGEFKAKYDKLTEGEKAKLTAEQLEEELLADFTGDALADPKFLQHFAREGEKPFKRFLRVVIDWLKDTTNKLSKAGFGSSRYFTDIDKLRRFLYLVLYNFSKRNSVSDIASVTPPSLRRIGIAKPPLVPLEAKILTDYREKHIALEIPKKKITKESIKQALEKVYTKFVMAEYPVEKLAKMSKDPQAMETISNQIRRIKGKGGLAEEMLIGKGPFSITNFGTKEEKIVYKKDAKSLHKILQRITSEEMRQDYETLRIAERDVALARFRPDIKHTNLAESSKIVSIIENKYGEKISELRDISSQHRNFERQTILEPLRDIGWISQKHYQDIIDAPESEYYASFSREMDHLDETVMRGKDPLKRIKGSEKRKVPTIESTIANVYKTVKLVQTLQLNKEVVKLAPLTPDLSEIIKEVKPNYIPVKQVLEAEVDPLMREQLNAIVHGLDASIQTLKNIGRNKMGQFITKINTTDLSMEEINRIELKFATTEKTYAHELGHLIDKKFNLQTLLIKGKGGDYPITKKELRKIADQRAAKDSSAYYKKYIRERGEQVAEFVSRYLTQPDQARSLAPEATKKLEAFFTSKPQLKKLLDIQPSGQATLACISDVLFVKSPIQPKNTIVVPINGMKHFWEVPPDVHKALDYYSPKEVSMIVQLMSYPARWLRAGATLSPEFMSRNFFRDQFTAMVYAKYGYYPFWDFGKGLYHLLGKTDLYHEYKAAGAEQAYFTSLDRTTLQVRAQDVMGYKKGMLAKFNLRTVNPVELLRVFSEAIEKSTRLGVAARAKAAGVSPSELMTQARESTLDFGRIGEERRINQVVAFWNANVQGIDLLRRNFTKSPGRTLFRATAGITIPTIALWLYNHSDEEREKRYNALPAWRKNFFWNLIISGGPIVSLPRPFELGIIFGALPERILDYGYLHDPEEFKSVAKALKDGLMPGFIPTAVLPLVENQTNWSFFTERPIESAAIQKLPPGMRSYYYTSSVAKKWGEMTNLSPLKLENWIKGWSGSLGRIGLDIADPLFKQDKDIPEVTEEWYRLVPGIKGLMCREPIGGAGGDVARFYDNLEDINQADQGFKALIIKDRSQAIAFDSHMGRIRGYATSFRRASRQMGKLRKQKATILKSKTISGRRKKELIKNLDERITRIAQTYNKSFKKRR